MQPEGDHRGGGKSLGERLATVAVPLLAIVTGVLFGVLWLAYSEFHAELGVRPADAGVQYGPELGGAAGIVVLIVGASVLVTAIVAAAWWLASKSDQPHRGLAPAPTAARLGVLAVATVVGLTGAVAVFMISGANARADAVKDGKPLEPLRIFGIEVLGIRADLADVEVLRPSTGSAATTTATAAILQALRDRSDEEKPLFYLGRTATSFVLYDSEHQTALYIPTATAVVQTHNCETKRRDDRCAEILRRVE